MKIVISINTTWNIYNFRINLIKEFQSLGHSIVAVAPEDEYVSKLEELNVKCFHVSLNSKGTNPINDVRLVYQYYKLFKDLKPDCILSYTIKPNIYGNFAANLLNIPSINNISGLGTLFIKKSIATHIGKLLYRFSLSSSYHVFFQNKDDKTLFIKNKLVDEKITSIIPGSGVDVDKFDCDRTKNIAKKFLFVGRLISDKGVLEYLDAAVSVLKKYPKKEFLLVGELGSLNNTAISKKQIEKYTNNYNQITYLGKTDDIKKVLQSVDIMILPSYREGLSRSLLEAAAMKLPIITTNVPGCRDVVEDGFNGFLCEVKSKYSLEKAIYKLISLTENKRLELGIKGREKVTNEFSSEIVNKIYKKKINEIMKSQI
jgi:glycosyltransferase involved in cell wall biosynthesis